MSYSIKRTPYFRRMFNNSRRNGELQRLREEYERIQEFNDRTIELKMRQVRLKRLFREIEDINEAPSLAPNASRPRPQPAPPQLLLPLTPEAQQAQQRRERLEALERARELGQEISRRNAELAENGNGYYLRSELRSTAKMRAADEARREVQERRQRAARRISYGNAQSRSNIERIAQRRLRQEVVDSLIFRPDQHASQHAQVASLAQPNQDIIKRSMLQQRLQYGNSRSTNNMMRSQIAAAQRVINCITVPNDELEMDHCQNQMAIDASTNKHDITLTSAIDNNMRKSNCNNSTALNLESDLEMQTAMLPPTEPDTMHSSHFSDDDMPSTSQKALRMSDLAATATTTATTITGFQSPRPSQDMCPSLSPSERASERWHRISLTLPWIKVTHNRSAIDAPIVELPNINISIAQDDQLGDNSNTSVTGVMPEQFQSFRGPSLLQEDLMQIMELEENGKAQF